MSLYNYPSVHGMKDLANIYSDREWDDARLSVWDPVQQKHYRIAFCGSTRPTEGEAGVLHFTLCEDQSEGKFHSYEITYKDASGSTQSHTINSREDLTSSNIRWMVEKVFGSIIDIKRI